MNLDAGNDLLLRFNHEQLQVIRWAPSVPALLSLLGSLLVAQRIARSKKLLSRTYERLILGLCVVDTITSIRLIIFSCTYFHPYNEPSTACTVHGFFVILCLSGPLYNAALAVYYVLIIVYGVPDRRLASHYEPWFHATVILYGAMGAFLGLTLQVYNPRSDGYSCWSGEWPPGCTRHGADGRTCERGRHAAAFAYGVAVVPLFSILVLLVIANGAIYRTVRLVVTKTSRYTNPSSGFVSTALESAASSMDDDREQAEAPSATLTSARSHSGAVLAPSKVKEVAAQSIAYVLAYLICFVWPLIVGTAELLDPATKHPYIFVLHVMQMIFYPSQGLFNAFVYARPMVARMRKEDSRRSRWHCFCSVFFS